MGTTSISNFPMQVASMFPKAIEQGTIWASRIIWSSIKNFVFEHWVIILLVLLLLFILAIVKFVLDGRWGMLGSLMYRTIYGTGLFVITLVFGPEIFASAWIDIFLVIFGVVCFEFVGYLLKKFKVKK